MFITESLVAILVLQIRDQWWLHFCRRMRYPVTRQKTRKLFPVDENRLQQCCAAPHEQCCQQHVAILSITRCNNVVDNIVEACSHQPGTTCAFFAVYAALFSSTGNREQLARFLPCTRRCFHQPGTG